MEKEVIEELNNENNMPSEDFLGNSSVQKEKNSGKKLYSSMLKVGCIAFGGGTSTIPIFEKSCVERDNLVTKDDFTDEIVVANITPGAVPIKLGCGIGLQSKGVAGGYFSSMLVTLPGMLLSVIIVSLLGLLGQDIIKYLGFASIGVTVFVLYLMISFIAKTVKTSKKDNNLIQVLVIIAISFILTVGGKLSGFIGGLIGTGIEYNPFFSLSVIEIIIACFYLILFTAGKQSKVKIPVCAIVLIYYFVAVGKNSLPTVLKYIAYAIMALTIIINVVITLISKKKSKALAVQEVLADAVVDTSRKSNSKVSLFNELKPALKIALIYFAFIVVYTLILMLIDWKNAKTVLDYCAKGCLSVLSTFGGGAIYYPVAEGIFVDSGMISSQVFNVELITVANALPGPVLVKMLSTIGYKIGYSVAGSMLTGYLYSFLGLFIGVGISCITFAIVFIIFKHFGKLAIFGKIRGVVLPAICGLLLSTIISLLSATFTAGGIAGVKGYYTMLIVAVLYVGVYFICKKTKLPEIVPILGSGGITLGVYSLLMLV